MNYIIADFDCEILGDGVHKLKANVPYVVNDVCNMPLTCVGENAKFNINLYECLHGFATLKNCTLVNFKMERYLFLFGETHCDVDVRLIEFEKKMILIHLSGKLIVDYADKQIVNMPVTGIKYSHYEIKNGVCFIFFDGDCKFLVALNCDGLLWADYYDEYNVEKDEKIILKHLRDSLNHGKAMSFNLDKTEPFLVYLDDYEMNLKPEFTALVFMDCLKAGNLNYCEKLLGDNFKCDKNALLKFFPEFDNFFPLNALTVVLFKKNALVGICSFEIVEDKIENIIIN